MKALTTTQKNQIPHHAEFEKQVINVVTAALEAVEHARQKCFLAGQLLNEWKETLSHGEFLPWMKKHFPQVSEDSCNRWMRAAENISRALPEAPVDVEVTISAVLTLPEAELTSEQKKYRQQWFDFTEGKTIKECAAGVFVDGDDAHRIDRAINGKTKGGSKGEDRKDFPLFVAVKLKDMGAHLKHWSRMNAQQRAEIQEVMLAAINGDEATLRGRNAGRPIRFHMMPIELCEVISDACKARIKGGGK